MAAVSRLQWQASASPSSFNVPAVKYPVSRRNAPARHAKQLAAVHGLALFWCARRTNSLFRILPFAAAGNFGKRKISVGRL